jgi:hypothetical protein
MTTKYNIDYLKFDAFSMKRLLTQKLSENPNFTDQIYEGSNLSIIIDTFSYMFQTLMFYINHGASEAMLSDSQLYENINRIVKMFGYNPIGYISSVGEFNIRGFVSYDGSDSKILPKFSTITTSKVDSFGKPISFSTVNNYTLYSGKDEDNFVVMHNGRWRLYERTFISEGIPYERFILSDLTVSTQNGNYVSHPHIAVFIKTQSGEWKIFDPIENVMFFNEKTFNTYQSTDRIFEVRINENLQYEIKFGDGIYGERLSPGEEIYIAYLSSNGPEGKVSANIFNEASTSGKISIGISGLSDAVFKKIFENSYLMWIDQFSQVYATNSQATSFPKNEETADEIRNNAPQWFKSTGRAITQNDFKYIITSQFSSNIIDVKILNNWQLAESLYRWLYNLEIYTGQKYLTKTYANKFDYPWADSCDFNNIYIFLKLKSTTDVTKQYIEKTVNKLKPLTSELVFIDPFTTFFSPCAISSDEIAKKQYSFFNFDPEYENYIEILVNSNSNISPEIVRSNVLSEIIEYFEENNQKIGSKIDINQLEGNIYAIPGVARIRTVFKDSMDSTSSKYLPTKIIPGLCFACWTNRIVSGADVFVSPGSVQLEQFQFPSIVNSNTNKFSNRIKVITNEIFSTSEQEY